MQARTSPLTAILLSVPLHIGTKHNVQTNACHNSATVDVGYLVQTVARIQSTSDAAWRPQPDAMPARELTCVSAFEMCVE